MHRLRVAELPHREGDPRAEPARTEEVLPQGTETHRSQGIAEEVEYSPPPSPDGDNGEARRLIARAGFPGRRRGVAQLVEHWSPKPAVERSSRSAPALG